MSVKTKKDMDKLKEAGRIVNLVLSEMRKHVRPGVSTREINAIGEDILLRNGARSAPMFIYNFPAAVCISVNEEIVHGVPSERIVEAGDLVKLDVVAEKDGYMADAAITVPVAPVSYVKRMLVGCAEKAFRAAAKAARAGNRIFDIGRTVEREVTRCGFSIVRSLSGHGVGRSIHEPPNVPNFYDPRFSRRLTLGMVLAVEPILTQGSGEAIQSADDWTIKTADGSLSAHYEHTLVVTNGLPIILTGA